MKKINLLSVVFTLLASMMLSCEEQNSVSDSSNVFTESGMYLGIIGFNDHLMSKPIGLLNNNSADNYKKFVQELQIAAGTALYYAEEEAINSLKNSRFPDDVESVSVVTFTDGLDQGSNAYNNQYSSALSYLDAVNRSLHETIVAGNNISAYSVGLKGKDVSDMEMFNNNLIKLSSKNENKFEVSDIEQVNACFKNIASSLYNSTSIHILSINIPSLYDGNHVRFTFDDVSYAEQSQCYIEGVWKGGSLTQLEVKGCNYSGPSIVHGLQNGVNYQFVFSGLSSIQNEALSLSHIMEYYKDTSSWQRNSEFNKDRDAEQKIEQKSAVIMLVLDCSSSLGDDFTKMKNAAQEFISLLVNTSEQNNIVSFNANGGTGSMSNMIYLRGQSKALTANLFSRVGYTFKNWNTKADGSGMTYFNREEIKLNGDITLYAQWDVYKDNGVANGYEWVDLGLSSGTKWATVNVGATSPEDYGDYFAWGETSSKSSYTYCNYKWYNDCSELAMSKYITDSSYGIVDNKTILELSDDAAYVNWGDLWRMPTSEESKELLSECNWIWTTKNGVDGYEVASKTNDNSIFLPAAGHKDSYEFQSSWSYYWNSLLDFTTEEEVSDSNYIGGALEFDSYNLMSGGCHRYMGAPVRAVLR